MWENLSTNFSARFRCFADDGRVEEQNSTLIETGGVKIAPSGPLISRL